MVRLYALISAIIFIFLSLYSVQISSSPTTQEILVHIRLTQQIKQFQLMSGPSFYKSPHRKSPQFTQTEAYLRVNRELVNTIWGPFLSKYDSMINAIMARELTFKDDYYVFYHAQKSYYRILHDVVKEVYKIFAMEPEFADFKFLRAWFDSPEKIDVQEFLTMHESFLDGSWHEFASQQMLCANLALFGNSNSPWECTFFYFVNNSNIMPPSLQGCLQTFFDTFHFDNSFIKDLLAVVDKVATQEGLLYQIFIPKDKVDQYAYLSDVCIAPWSRSINAPYFDPNKKRHTALSPIIDQYCNDPFSIPEIDRIQVRILLSQDLLLNPASGIKVFRYTTAFANNEQEYEQELKNIVHKMVVQWLDNHKLRAQLAHHAVVRSMPLGKFLKDFKPKA